MPRVLLTLPLLTVALLLGELDEAADETATRLEKAARSSIVRFHVIKIWQNNSADYE